MRGQTAEFAGFHEAIRSVRERSRACRCIARRQKLIALERALMSLLLAAEEASAGRRRTDPPAPRRGWWQRTHLRGVGLDFRRWAPIPDRRQAW
ncbi:hypothetical protein [Azospirillum sp. SYSU D00513]|uniref:hypothetical protein n=1 Tax=Azospirillum sp. SYSU D00513 TaxID=2812561 RepID=UPI001A96CE01|nr:hypothetical protein [Azospirillum sp. SYSU D00513]